MDTEATSPHVVWNIPNVISMVRIVLIGVFFALLVAGHDAWALAALVLAGISDFFDGYLARRWNQTTPLGRLLDPAADRLLTASVAVGLAVREMVPWWLVVVLLARDLMVGIALWRGYRAHLSAPLVSRAGKWATFLLYVFLPLAFLSFERWPEIHTWTIVGATIAAAVYWYAGIGYVREISQRLKSI